MNSGCDGWPEEADSNMVSSVSWWEEKLWAPHCCGGGLNAWNMGNEYEQRIGRPGIERSWNNPMTTDNKIIVALIDTNFDFDNDVNAFPFPPSCIVSYMLLAAAAELVYPRKWEGGQGHVEERIDIQGSRKMISSYYLCCCAGLGTGA